MLDSNPGQLLKQSNALRYPLATPSPCGEMAAGSMRMHVLIYVHIGVYTCGSIYGYEGGGGGGFTCALYDTFLSAHLNLFTLKGTGCSQM